MAAVQYVNVHENQKLRAGMFSPKKIQETSAWFKTARVAIPKIPDPARTDWQITHTEISTTHVVFKMANSVGHTATVTIDRRMNSLGI